MKGIVSKEPRTTINPYYNSVVSILKPVALAVKRLGWDLNPLSWASRKKVKKWKDKYAGQKAVILCNGPSLNKVDFGQLDKSGVFTFGLNKINLLFPRTEFRPSVIVAVNPYVIEQNAKFYNETDIPLFLDSNGSKYVEYRKNIHFLHSSGCNGQFAQDCSISINQGFTVTYVAMQLAFHMGFTSVALVGCDHTFATKGPANKLVVSGQTDPNHFDPNYFSGGLKWNLPDLTQSELSYMVAKHLFESYDRKIVNCTEGGNLELLERIGLSDFLST